MKNQSGRSMIEMLGVLAIIGVLSLGGVAVFNAAMNRHTANNLTYDVMLMAESTVSGGTALEEMPFEAGTEYDNIRTLINEEGEIRVVVSSVGKDVCDILLSKGGNESFALENVSGNPLALCADRTDIVFAINSEVLNADYRGIPCQSKETCPAGQECYMGVCRTPSLNCPHGCQEGETCDEGKCCPTYDGLRATGECLYIASTDSGCETFSLCAYPYECDTEIDTCVCANGAIDDGQGGCRVCDYDCGQNPNLIPNSDCNGCVCTLDNCQQAYIDLASCECVNECPTEAPYVSDGTCVAECPQGLIQINNVCTECNLTDAQCAAKNAETPVLDDATCTCICDKDADVCAEDSSSPYFDAATCSCVNDPCLVIDPSWTATEPDVSRTYYLGNVASACEVNPAAGAFTLEQLQVGTTEDGTACYCDSGYYTYFENGCASDAKSCQECPGSYEYFNDNEFSALFSCQTGKWWYDEYTEDFVSCDSYSINYHESNSLSSCQYKWDFCDLSGTPMMMGRYCFSCDNPYVEYAMSTADTDLVNATCGWSGEDACVYAGYGEVGYTYSCAQVKADIEGYYGVFYADSDVCETVRYNDDEGCFGWDCTQCTSTYESGDEYCQYVGNTCGLDLQWSEDRGGCTLACNLSESSCTGDTPFFDEYNCECVATCPKGPGVCNDWDTPILDMKTCQCVAECPEGTIRNDSDGTCELCPLDDFGNQQAVIDNECVSCTMQAFGNDEDDCSSFNNQCGFNGGENTAFFIEEEGLCTTCNVVNYDYIEVSGTFENIKATCDEINNLCGANLYPATQYGNFYCVPKNNISSNMTDPSGIVPIAPLASACQNLSVEFGVNYFCETFGFDQCQGPENVATCYPCTLSPPGASEESCPLYAEACGNNFSAFDADQYACVEPVQCLADEWGFYYGPEGEGSGVESQAVCDTLSEPCGEPYYICNAGDACMNCNNVSGCGWHSLTEEEGQRMIEECGFENDYIYYNDMLIDCSMGGFPATEEECTEFKQLCQEAYGKGDHYYYSADYCSGW